MAGKNRVPVTVFLAAKNEQINMPKCLASLKPAAKIVVLDSHSKDRTGALSRAAGAQVVQFNYRGGYPKKRQWALDHLKITTPWVLLIDADEEVPPGLWAEIEAVVADETSSEAYLIEKEYHFLGRRLRFGGFSFDAVLLFKTGKARFEHMLDEPSNALDMEVHERLIVDGRLGKLRTPLIHRDFKSLDAFIDRHNKYSTWDALIRKSFFETERFGDNPIQAKFFGNIQERRRFLKTIAIRIPLEPTLWFVYHYFLRLGFLEGRRGFVASRMRSNHIFQIRAKLYELNLKKEDAGSAPEKTAHA